MREMEMCAALGIVLDPDRNKLSVTPELACEIAIVSFAFLEINTQREVFGQVNEDLWLEFIPWHSLN
jgi:hypothetical protein